MIRTSLACRSYVWPGRSYRMAGRSYMAGRSIVWPAARIYMDGRSYGRLLVYGRPLVCPPLDRMAGRSLLYCIWPAARYYTVYGRPLVWPPPSCTHTYRYILNGAATLLQQYTGRQAIRLQGPVPVAIPYPKYRYNIPRKNPPPPPPPRNK